MDLMSLHPKASEDSSGDLLRTLEPKDATEEEFYYHTTDMPTEMVRLCSRLHVQVMLSAGVEQLEAARDLHAAFLAVVCCC
jgi:hypothetical protein